MKGVFYHNPHFFVMALGADSEGHKEFLAMEEGFPVRDRGQGRGGTDAIN